MESHVHHKESEMICLKDMQVVCKECTDSHKNHEIISLQKVYAILSDKARQEQIKINDQKAFFQSQLIKLEIVLERLSEVRSKKNLEIADHQKRILIELAKSRKSLHDTTITIEEAAVSKIKEIEENMLEIERVEDSISEYDQTLSKKIANTDSEFFKEKLVNQDTHKFSIRSNFFENLKEINERIEVLNNQQYDVTIIESNKIVQRQIQDKWKILANQYEDIYTKTEESKKSLVQIGSHMKFLSKITNEMLESLKNTSAKKKRLDEISSWVEKNEVNLNLLNQSLGNLSMNCMEGSFEKIQKKFMFHIYPSLKQVRLHLFCDPRSKVAPLKDDCITVKKFSMCNIGLSIFITGGYSSYSQTSTSKTKQLDYYVIPNKIRDFPRADLKVARDSHCAVVVNSNQFLVLGGATTEKDGKYHLNSCEIYDIFENKFSDLPMKLKYGHINSSACCLSSKFVYVIGGHISESSPSPIEFLDIEKMEEWETFEQSSEISEKLNFPLCFEFEKNQIIIFFAGKDYYILDTEDKVIEKKETSLGMSEISTAEFKNNMAAMTSDGFRAIDNNLIEYIFYKEKGSWAHLDQNNLS